MAKAKATGFFCQSCGYESAKWMGQCPACHEWNTFVEEPVAPAASGKSAAKPTAGVVRWGELTSKSARSGGNTDREPLAAGRGKALPLKEIHAGHADRRSTGIAEMDRVLGGGLVQGSLVLVGGDPGIGKSTLLLQVCRNLTQTVREMDGESGTAQAEATRVLYVSGEESQQQIKLRANRMGEFGDSLLLLCETNLSDVQEAIVSLAPQVVVIDYIQTMYSDTISSAPGSVSQVRETTGVLLQLAKGLGVTIFIVGHVTKEGAVAGPRVLEHMVDTVLYFEGDRHASYRILHAVKNRFGSTDEIGVFEMKQDGLSEVSNPSEFMLEGRPEGASGSVVACSLEGSRPILIEVQALTARSTLAYPRRTADGADLNRVNLLLAVLERRLGLRMSEADVYVNIAGGVRLREPAVDLGIVTALLSSFKDIVIDEKTMVFGEVGLSGEVRSVSQAPLRVREAQKLGFTTVILPQACLKAVGKAEGVRLIGVRSVRDLISALTQS